MDREVTTSKLEELVRSASGPRRREASAYVFRSVDEREPHGTTIYNTILYFGPDGQMIDKHRKPMPTGLHGSRERRVGRRIAGGRRRDEGADQTPLQGAR